MKRRFSPSCHHRSRLKALTFVEVVICGTLLAVLTTYGFRSMMEFTEQRKLRTAALELSGYLQVARGVAYAENGRCQIDLMDETSAIFGPATGTAFTNACAGSSLPPSLNLRGLSGSRKLTASAVGFPLTFNPGGTVIDGATVWLGSTTVPSGVWCVDVGAPLATVRLGWAATSGGDCTYAIGQ